MKHLNLEQLAEHSLRMTDEYCPDTMLAHFIALNKGATDEELNQAHEQIEEFIEYAC